MNSFEGNRTVMVVDDEQFFRLILKKMLTDAGFTVVAEASDGDDAVRCYRELSPSLVLMDIYMPTKNGIDATREIIAINPEAKIIVCSGTGYEEDVDSALQAGARGVVFKPFYEEEVLQAIKDVCAS